MGYQRYRRDYKHNALRIVKELGSARAAAKQLGISPETICRWLRNPSAIDLTDKKPNPEKDTLNELRREIRELKELVRVLRHALSFYQDHVSNPGDKPDIFQ